MNFTVRKRPAALVAADASAAAAAAAAVAAAAVNGLSPNQSGGAVGGVVAGGGGVGLVSGGGGAGGGSGIGGGGGGVALAGGVAVNGASGSSARAVADAVLNNAASFGSGNKSLLFMQPSRAAGPSTRFACERRRRAQMPELGGNASANVAPLTEQEQYRCKVIDEIVNTEMDYIDSLELMLRVFYEPLKSNKVRRCSR